MKNTTPLSHVKIFPAVLLAVCLLLAACATTKYGEDLTSAERRLRRDIDRKLQGLLARNDFEPAMDLIVASRDHLPPLDFPVMQAITGDIQARYVFPMLDRMDSEARWLDQLDRVESADEWPQAEAAIRQNRRILQLIERYTSVIDDRATADRISRLSLAMESSAGNFQRNAHLAFAEYDHLSGPCFFDVYPVAINKSAIFGEGFPALIDQLNNAPAEKASNILRPGSIFSELDTGQKTKIYDLLVNRNVLAGQAPPMQRVERAIELNRAARALDFDPTLSRGGRVVLFSIRPPAPSATMEVPLVWTPSGSTESRIIGSVDELDPGSFDFAIVYEAVGSRIEHVNTVANTIESRYISGQYSEANPDYVQAVNRAEEERTEYRIAETEFKIATATLQRCERALQRANEDNRDRIRREFRNSEREFEQAKSKLRRSVQDLNSAESRLAAIPETIQKDAFTKYWPEKTTETWKKFLTLRLYFFDAINAESTMATSEVELSNFEFTQYTGMHPADEKLNRENGGNQRDFPNWLERLESISLHGDHRVATILHHARTEWSAVASASPAAE